jgi:hypothetical protein
MIRMSKIILKKRRAPLFEKLLKKTIQKSMIKLKTQDSKTHIFMASPSINFSLHWQIAGNKEHFLTAPLGLKRS